MNKLDRQEGWSAAGPKTLMEMMEEELDSILDDIMVLSASGSNPASLKETQAQARGFVWAMALWINPYEPDDKVVEIRAAMMRRWETRKEEVL